MAEPHRTSSLLPFTYNFLCRKTQKTPLTFVKGEYLALPPCFAAASQQRPYGVPSYSRAFTGAPVVHYLSHTQLPGHVRQTPLYPFAASGALWTRSAGLLSCSSPFIRLEKIIAQKSRFVNVFLPVCAVIARRNVVTTWRSASFGTSHWKSTACSGMDKSIPYENHRWCWPVAGACMEPWGILHKKQKPPFYNL